MSTNSFGNLLNYYEQYMHLKIFIDSDDSELIDKYRESVKNHNTKVLTDVKYIDAGFDLFNPQEIMMNRDKVNKLDYKVSCAAKIKTIHDKEGFNTGFYMYPRSSISKSNLRLANNMGIIDAGYRGHLTGMFDLIYADEIIIKKFEKHLQICAPSLIPILIEMVNSKEELGEITVRGDGGFGSTGL